jgi:hypothetical protein
MDFIAIKSMVNELGFDRKEYALFGSVPLAAHGIREANDIDMIVMRGLYERLEKSGWMEKVYPVTGKRGLVKDQFEAFYEWNYVGYTPDVSKLIREADIIDDIPVVRLAEVLKWKTAFGREKDIKDVELIRRFMHDNPSAFKLQ